MMVLWEKNPSEQSRNTCMAELRETQGHTMSGMEGGREMAWMYKVFSITWPAASHQR